VEEEGSALVRARIAEAPVVGTSFLAYVEARAALARRRRAGHLSEPNHRRAVRDFEVDWERYIRLDITERVIRDAARLAERHPLRAGTAREP
jgi:uncharacterized protein with PIN domain